MPRKKVNPSSTPITSLTHADQRANIPTEELRDFVADEERNPKSALYPRDPSLDLQLVWKGKDEQDQHPLEVPAINNHGRFGRWAFLEISDPWDAHNTIRAFIRGEKVESV